MTEGSFGLIVEGLVSVLLVATIFYCISVNRKLERLRKEQKGMHKFIRELSNATAKADQAIQGLRATVQDSGAELAGQIDKSRNMSRTLKGEIDSAEQIINKLVVLMSTSNSAPIVSSEPARAGVNMQKARLSQTVDDLRKSMLGFDDLENEPSKNDADLYQGLVVGVKGAA